MASPEPLTRRVLIEGFVQGVGYRDFARRAALRLRISGWVRNRVDGTVEAMISGAPDAVEAMLAELRRGPRGAQVRSVRLTEAGPEESTEGGFVVRSTAYGVIE
jgi:acylphosphatase